MHTSVINPNSIDCRDVLSNIDGGTYMLLSNEMIGKNTTFTDDILQPSSPLVEYSQDEIEHSSSPNITACSNNKANVSTAACTNSSALHSSKDPLGPVNQG